MSADNYLCVVRRDDEFAVLHLSASCDYTSRQLAEVRPLFVEPTLEAALLAAHKEEQRGYYEYGVSLARGLEEPA